MTLVDHRDTTPHQRPFWGCARTSRFGMGCSSPGADRSRIAARQRLEPPLILEAVRLFNKTQPNPVPVGGAIPRVTKAYGAWMSRDEDMNKDLD